jgi:hypothetical protein
MIDEQIFVFRWNSIKNFVSDQKNLALSYTLLDQQRKYFSFVDEINFDLDMTFVWIIDANINNNQHESCYD